MGEFVPVADASLWTVTTGAGPPLVLCHGGPGIWDDLGDLASLVDARCTVYRYDQRGCGRSSGAGPFTLSRFVEDLERLRAHWGHERWIVGGHSFGTSLALAYAVAHPERTRALALVATTGLDRGWREAYRAASAARLSAAQRERLAELVDLRESTQELHDEFCALTWFVDFVDREGAVETARRTLRPGARVNFTLNRALNEDTRRVLGSSAFRAAVSALSVPALVVHGEGDPRPAWPGQRLAALLGADHVTVPDAGHLPWVEQPERVRAALDSFLGRLPEEASS